MTTVASSKTSGNSTDSAGKDVSGLGLDAILDSQFRDIAALAQATQQVRQHLDTVADRQGELLMSAMHQFRSHVKDEAGSVSGRAEQARQVLGGALRYMRELAELTVKSHEQVFSTVSGRVQERLAKLGKPA